VRGPGGCLHYQRPAAGRWRHRPARHARSAGLLPGHDCRGRGAHAPAPAVWRGAHVAVRLPPSVFSSPSTTETSTMQFTHEHREIQKTLKRFIDEEINPHVDEWEAAEIFPAHEVFKKRGNLGLLGLCKPEAY